MIMCVYERSARLKASYRNIPVEVSLGPIRFGKRFIYIRDGLLSIISRKNILKLAGNETYFISLKF